MLAWHWVLGFTNYQCESHHIAVAGCEALKNNMSLTQWSKCEMVLPLAVLLHDFPRQCMFLTYRPHLHWLISLIYVSFSVNTRSQDPYSLQVLKTTMSHSTNKKCCHAHDTDSGQNRWQCLCNSQSKQSLILLWCLFPTQCADHSILLRFGFVPGESVYIYLWWLSQSHPARPTTPILVATV